MRERKAQIHRYTKRCSNVDGQEQIESAKREIKRGRDNEERKTRKRCVCVTEREESGRNAKAMTE